MKSESFIIKYKSILTFLIVEIVTLLAIGINSLTPFLSILGIGFAVFGTILIFSFSKNKKNLFSFILMSIILFAVSGIASFNSYSELYGKFSFQNICLFFTIPSFFILGYAVKKSGEIKSCSLVLIIGAGFAAITLFGLFSTLFSYGFFYSLRFKSTPFYYYEGNVFDVTREMYWLTNFTFEEVTIEYGCLFALLSSCYLPGLLFLDFKKNRNQFIATLAIGIIGLITLIIIPNFTAICILLFSSIGAFILKFFKTKNRVVQIAKYSLFVIVILGVAFFLLAIINVAIGYKFPGVLDKLFVNNRFMVKVTPVLEKLFEGRGENLFGLVGYTSNLSTIYLDSQIFEVQLLKEVGLIGTLLFMFFLKKMLTSLLKYAGISEDNDFSKSIILTLVFAFFIYQSLKNTIAPYAHNNEIISFLRSPTILVILFVFGFVFASSRKESE